MDRARRAAQYADAREAVLRRRERLTSESENERSAVTPEQ